MSAPNADRKPGFELGCHWRGILRDGALVPVDEQFRMIRDAGVFDYLDRLPPTDLVAEYRRCSEKYGIPMRTGTWYYQLGQDEPLLEEYLQNAARLGLVFHNIMIFTRHADGHALTDDEIADCYERIWHRCHTLGILPSFELHVNMWNEDFRRVIPVAEKVRTRGIPFNLTVDYSHCVFKIENPAEQDISGIRADVEAGRVVLDPFEKNSLCQQWLDMDIVVYAQFRPVAPNGPLNVWANEPPGRGIQYPFLKPAPGEWHSAWHAWKLEASKQAMRRILHYHLMNRGSPLRFVTTEMIDLPDYGENARYSIFDHNVACAHWIRDCWKQMTVLAAQGAPILI
jgi:hypothetical protein